jgi:predicted Ser/Thr protein kinase
MPARPRVIAVLKRDALGRVELLLSGSERRVRRVASGGRLPGSRQVARALLAREARALRSLDGTPGVPCLLDTPDWVCAPSISGDVPRENEVLVRSFVVGEPLHRAKELPEDFFERLEELVVEVHARGVCHNDLHKEQNVVVGSDGRPGLVDFQLASIHERSSRMFVSRVRDDLRHVHKHKRRYTAAGRGPESSGESAFGGATEPGSSAPAASLRRSWTAAIWRRVAKPVYNFVTRRLLRAQDGEERRESAGPWPRWTAAVGPRERGG